MINTSGQDASLLQWNVTGPGGGGGGPTSGPSLLPEPPPQAERQSKKEKSATTLATSVYICRSYVSCVAPDPCTGRSYRRCCLVTPPIAGCRPNTIQAIRGIAFDFILFFLSQSQARFLVPLWRHGLAKDADKQSSEIRHQSLQFLQVDVETRCNSLRSHVENLVIQE